MDPGIKFRDDKAKRQHSSHLLGKIKRLASILHEEDIKIS